MDYKNKYVKYKTKYLQLKKMNMRGLIGGKPPEKNQRYDCKPDQDKFVDICIPSNNGKYKTQQKCFNDCENKFINNQLVKANIKSETYKFYLFIKEIIEKEQIDVYIKGGNVIGIMLLKMIYDKYKNNDKKFEECFNEFLKLGLIKDWDFASYTTNTIRPEYRNKLDGIAKKYQLVPRAKKFILYQTRKPIMLENKVLFEIAVLDTDDYSSLELPLTTMKIKINEYNIKYIFMFAKSFFSYEKGESFDMDIIKRMIEKMNVLIHPHKDGLYDFNNKNKFDKGNINDELLTFINDFTKNNMTLTQFLVTHLEDPFRMLYRLPEKNIPKTNKIKEFIKNELNTEKMPSWLINTEKVSDNVNKFAEKIGKKLKDIYTDEIKKNKTIQESMDKVLGFLDGVDFGRLQIEIKNKLITDNNIKLLSTMIKPLIDAIGKENINNLQSNNKTVQFLTFYAHSSYLNA